MYFAPYNRINEQVLRVRFYLLNAILRPPANILIYFMVTQEFQAVTHTLKLFRIIVIRLNNTPYAIIINLIDYVKEVQHTRRMLYFFYIKALKQI